MARCFLFAQLYSVVKERLSRKVERKGNGIVSGLQGVSSVKKRFNADYVDCVAKAGLSTFLYNSLK